MKAMRSVKMRQTESIVLMLLFSKVVLIGAHPLPSNPEHFYNGIPQETFQVFLADGRRQIIETADKTEQDNYQGQIPRPAPLKDLVFSRARRMWNKSRSGNQSSRCRLWLEGGAAGFFKIGFKLCDHLLTV